MPKEMTMLGKLARYRRVLPAVGNRGCGHGVDPATNVVLCGSRGNFYEDIGHTLLLGDCRRCVAIASSR